MVALLKAAAGSERAEQVTPHRSVLIICLISPISLDPKFTFSCVANNFPLLVISMLTLARLPARLPARLQASNAIKFHAARSTQQPLPASAFLSSNSKEGLQPTSRFLLARF